MTDEAGAIWRRVREANEAWVDGRPLATAELFHPDVVMLSPAGEVVSEGRGAMVESFVAYAERATTHRFEEVGHEVRVFGDAAVVTYRFEIEYELDGERTEESGGEVLVLARDDEGWRAVTRIQLPHPPPR